LAVHILHNGPLSSAATFLSSSMFHDSGLLGTGNPSLCGTGLKADGKFGFSIERLFLIVSGKSAQEKVAVGDTAFGSLQTTGTRHRMSSPFKPRPDTRSNKYEELNSFPGHRFYIQNTVHKPSLWQALLFSFGTWEWADHRCSTTQ
jgi:hypothetical protein